MRNILLKCRILLLAATVILGFFWLHDPDNARWEPITVLVTAILTFIGFSLEKKEATSKHKPELTFSDLDPSFKPEFKDPPSFSKLEKPRPLPFIGREKLLSEIVICLQAKLITVLTGPPGIGKSHLALEFAYRYGGYFPGGIFWIESTEPAKVFEEIERCGWLFGIREDDPEKLVERTRQKWRTSDQKLLIFNHCPDPKIFASWQEPWGNTSVLITTENQMWGSIEGIQKTIKVNPFDKSESLKFLQTFIEHKTLNEVLVGKLLAQLQGSPIAIRAAGEVLSHSKGSLEETLSEITHLQEFNRPLEKLFNRIFDLNLAKVLILILWL